MPVEAIYESNPDSIPVPQHQTRFKQHPCHGLDIFLARNDLPSLATHENSFPSRRGRYNGLCNLIDKGFQRKQPGFAAVVRVQRRRDFRERCRSEGVVGHSRGEWSMGDREGYGILPQKGPLCYGKSPQNWFFHRDRDLRENLFSICVTFVDRRSLCECFLVCGTSATNSARIISSIFSVFAFLSRGIL